MTRREFLQILARAGLTAPALASPFGCAPALVAPDSRTGLSLGYVAGDVTADSAVIWARAEPGSRIA
ncbi:MAG: alkaline phosphatase D family protein, partial [Candidatus Binatia bacterium]